MGLINFLEKIGDIVDAIVVHEPTESEIIVANKNAEARLAAEIEVAIAISDDPFIKRQLQYRSANGNYHYHDLIDKEKVMKAISDPNITSEICI